MMTQARIDACNQWIANHRRDDQLATHQSILDQFADARTDADLRAVHVRLHREIGIISSTMHFMNCATI